MLLWLRQVEGGAKSSACQQVEGETWINQSKPTLVTHGGTWCTTLFGERPISWWSTAQLGEKQMKGEDRPDWETGGNRQAHDQQIWEGAGRKWIAAGRKKGRQEERQAGRKADWKAADFYFSTVQSAFFPILQSAFFINICFPGLFPCALFAFLTSSIPIDKEVGLNMSQSQTKRFKANETAGQVQCFPLAGISTSMWDILKTKRFQTDVGIVLYNMRLYKKEVFYANR